MKFRLRSQALQPSRQLETLALVTLLLANATTSGAAMAQVGTQKPAAVKPNLSNPPLPVPKVIETDGSSNPIQQIMNYTIEQTPETIDKVAKLDVEGEKLFGQKMLDKALQKWQECYGLSIEMKFSEGQGRALVNMGRVFLEQGQFTKAKYMNENAIEVLYATSDKKDLGKARINLAQAFFGLENIPYANTQLAEALRLFTEEGGSNAAEAAEAMSLAGNVLTRMHRLKEALQFYQSASTYYNQAGMQEMAARNNITLCGIMEELGLYTAAHEEANKTVSMAKTAAEKGSKGSLVAALACLGNTQFLLCEYMNARKSYEQALQLAPQVDIKSLTNGARANVDVGYAFTLAATGDIEQAKTVLERALPALKADGSLYGQAQALNCLGVIEETQGNHGRALQCFHEALDLQSVIVPKQTKLHVVVLQNMAAAESRSGSNREAKAHLESALQILKNFGDPMLQGRTYASTAEVCLKLADMVGAEAFIKRSIETSEKCSDDSALWREYTILAIIQHQQNLPELKETLASALSHFRSPQAGVFPTPDRLSFPTSREDLGQKLVAMLAKQGMGEQALLAAEQLKEESFASEWLRRSPQVKPEDRDIYTDLSLQRAHLHAAEMSGKPDQLIKEWQNWLTRFSTVALQNRNLARLIAPVPSTTADIVRVVKANHATIVEYLVGGDSSVVFTIDGAGRISATVLAVGRKQLQSQVSALLAGSTNAAQDSQRERLLLQALYNELLPQGVRQFLPKNADQMVVIIPDSVLFNLPFAALVDPQGRYLVEHNTLTMASSMGTLLDSPPRYSADNSVVLTGGNENSMISSVFQPDQVTKLESRNTDMGSVQEQIRGKSIVHFSNHVPLSSNPMRAVLPFLPDKDDTSKNVTAERLFGMSMPSDLIVWSNSSINAKDVQGNAVKVFTRGLNYAGARNVLMSLWVAPEPDRTNELVEFYKGKQSGLNQAQSLRKAQMIALSKDPSPRSWAAFQLLGPGY